MPLRFHEVFVQASHGVFDWSRELVSLRGFWLFIMLRKPLGVLGEVESIHLLPDFFSASIICSIRFMTTSLFQLK